MTGEVPPRESSSTDSEQHDATNSITLDEELLADYAVDLALEVGEYDDLLIPDDCDDWSLNDLEVEEVDMEDDTTVVVEGEVTGTVTEQVRRAKRNPPGAAHPAEYKSHDVPIWVRIEWDLSERFSTDEVTIYGEALANPTAPPEPDVDAHRYDL